MPASVAFGIIRAMLAGTAANVVGYTYAYTYDDGGNILTQTKSGALPAETITYTYRADAWQDLLPRLLFQCRGRLYYPEIKRVFRQ